MMADPYPDHKPGTCHQCGKTPYAHVRHIVAEKDGFSFDQTLIWWGCCGVHWTVVPGEVELWCQTMLKRLEQERNHEDPHSI